MRDISEPRSGAFEVGSRRIHYVARGDPRLPPVILVHGMRDHARSWDWTALALADRYHVIAPDLRGHGDSDRADPSSYTIAAFVLDLAELVQTLGLARVELVGHSLGGAIVLRYAGTFPERVAALCAIEGVELPIVREQRDTPLAFPARLRAWIEAERGRRDRSPRRYQSLAEAEARMAAQYPTIDAGTITHLVRHGLIGGPGSGWRWKYDAAVAHRAPDDADGRDIDQTLAAIACPTLLAYGEASWIPLPPPERLVLIRDHRLATLPGASHWLHHEAREAFLAELVPFLNAHTPESANA